MKPKLLELCSCAGGSAMGYYRVGFDVTGVDLHDQPRFPFTFYRGGALAWLEQFICTGAWPDGETYDAIHASFPCQAFTRYRNRPGHVRPSPDLIGAGRELLRQTELPYVIENVEGAPLRDAVMLCGSSFGLHVRRHRYFEASFALLVPPCDHEWQRHLQLYPPATNRKNARNTVEVGTWRIPFETQAAAMGIDWMRARARRDVKGHDGHFGSELSQAIPPAYTELIGFQLRQHLDYAQGRSDNDLQGAGL